jgi:tetratricopeptide (TPR) repeat protein
MENFQYKSDYTKANNELGKNFFHNGDIERAEFYFFKSLEEDECSESLFYLGLIQNQKENYHEALSYYYRAILVDPEYGNPCNEIGVILLRHGKEREAVFWLKRSIRCSINDAPHIPLYNLATLYKIWNRPERSLQYLYKAIKLMPNFTEAIKLRDELQK